MARNRKTVMDTVASTDQGWIREVTYNLSGQKVRVTVYRDSYDFQSRIHVDVWSPTDLRWNTVQTLPGTEYADLPKRYATRAAWTTASTPIIAKMTYWSIEEAS